MKAELLFRERIDFDDGAILESVVWKVPNPLAGSRHNFKYRLFYGYPGHRVIGYDNERGKGDHRHVGGNEESYLFDGPEKLIADFIADVTSARSKT